MGPINHGTRTAIKCPKIQPFSILKKPLASARRAASISDTPKHQKLKNHFISRGFCKIIWYRTLRLPSRLAFEIIVLEDTGARFAATAAESRQLLLFLAAAHPATWPFLVLFASASLSTIQSSLQTTCGTGFASDTQAWLQRCAKKKTSLKSSARCSKL